LTFGERALRRGVERGLRRGLAPWFGGAARLVAQVTSPSRRYVGMRAVLVALGCLLTACGIPYGGDFLSPRWDPDGKHIFFLEQRFIMAPHPYEYFRLVRALPDRGDREKIDSGAIDSMWPSPDGRYLLYVDRFEGPGHQLAVYEIATEREALRIQFADHYPMDPGWRADGRAVLYTDAAGIHVATLDGAPPVLLVRGHRYGRAWSADGQILFYATGNGWPEGNQLRALEVASGADREVDAVSSGAIGPVAISPSGDRIAFVVELIEGTHASIRVVASAGGAVAELSRVSADRVTELAWAEPAETLLVGLQRSYPGEGAILDCLGPDRVMRKLTADPAEFAFGWDYHRRTNRLVVTRPDHRAFDATAWAGCDAHLPEL
jgi:hypothetical protein